MLTNPRDAFRGQSRSPNMVPNFVFEIIDFDDHETRVSQYQYQSQIYFTRASFVIKNALGGATCE